FRSRRLVVDAQCALCRLGANPSRPQGVPSTLSDQTISTTVDNSRRFARTVVLWGLAPARVSKALRSRLLTRKRTGVRAPQHPPALARKGVRVRVSGDALHSARRVENSGSFREPWRSQ